MSAKHRASRRRDRAGKGEGHGRIRKGRDEAPKAPAPSGPGAAQATEAAGRPSGRLSWWIRDEGRLERELAALRAAGYDPQPIEVAGRMRIRIKVRVNEQTHDFEVLYPDLFPLFRFHIYAPLGLFGRHQEPFTGALCILGPEGDAWDQDDTAAALLATQLPKIAAINAGGAPRELETDQVEPISQYIETMPGALFVLPREAYQMDRRQRSGVLTLALSSEAPQPPRGYVTHVGDVAGTLPDLRVAFPNARSREVGWTHVTELPRVTEPAQLAAALVKIDAIPPERPTDRPFSVYGIRFLEEVAYGEASGVGWLFICRLRQGRDFSVGLVRAERYTAEDQAERLRDIDGLISKRVVLFGLGALGAPITHLLLQARVGHLRGVDHDTLHLGNAVRWPLGFQYAGLPKAQALAIFAKANYPETIFEPIGWTIGFSHNDGQPDEGALLDQTFANADLVIDATADLAVQHLLAYEARARGVPLISVEAREGAYGGRVTRFRPGGACRTCLKYHQMDGRFRLPADTQDTPLPAGCTTPVFSAGSFDLVSLSALATRLAIQTLVPSERYPDTTWDVASLWNRESDAGEIGQTPRWEFDSLEVHPSCPEH